MAQLASVGHPYPRPVCDLLGLRHRDHLRDRLDGLRIHYLPGQQPIKVLDTLAKGQSVREPPGGVALLTLNGVPISLSREFKQLGVGQ